MYENNKENKFNKYYTNDIKIIKEAKFRNKK